MGSTRTALAVLLIGLALAGPAAADYASGARAFAAGENAAAVAAWEPLARAGDARAAFGLGVILERGGGGIARDERAAVAWYRRAAEAGLADAQLNLGNMLRLGIGVAEDPSAAVAWYRRAAEQGLPAAQFNIGRAYETGTGVARDYVEAARWYLRAAEQGDVDAALALAGLYRYGLGLPRDRIRALAWYRRAADAGDPRAAFHLRALADAAAGMFAGTQPPARQAVALGELATAAPPSPPRPASPAPIVAAAPPAATAPLEARPRPRRLAALDPEAMIAALSPTRRPPPAPLEVAGASGPLAAPVTPRSRPHPHRLAALAPVAMAPDVPLPPSAKPALATPLASLVEAADATAKGPGRRPRAALAALAAGPIALPAFAPAAEAAPLPETAPERVYRVQLGAYREPVIASHAWKRLVAKSDGLLAGLDPHIVAVDLGAERGVFYRLQAGPLADADAAQRLCRALAEKGTDCLVRRP